MSAADPRIRAVGRTLELVKSRRADPGKPAPAAVLLIMGLVSIFAGIASFSFGAAEIVAGVLLVVGAVGYMRGSD